AINSITYQIFEKVPHWGGVCLDQKGLYWEILVKMAAHFGREGDLVLRQTRPLGKDDLWRSGHTINITGNPNVPASTYAKVIVDTAVSLSGGRGQNPFFPTGSRRSHLNHLAALWSEQLSLPSWMRPAVFSRDVPSFCERHQGSSRSQL